MNEQHSISVKKAILEKIEQKRVLMKPRWYFILHGLLLVIGIILASMALLYVVSFAVFAVRENGALFAPQFGIRGIGVLLLSLPLLFVGLAIVFLIILEVLVKKYAFAYRKPLLYSVLGIACLVLFGGFIVDKTRFHDALFHQAMEGKLPFGGPLYGRFAMPDAHNGMVGQIVTTQTHTFSIRGRHHEVYAVTLTDTTQIASDTVLEPDAWVVVFGPRDDDTIIAEAIRGLSEPPIWMEHGARMMPSPNVFLQDK